MRRFSYIGTLTDPGVNDPQATNPAGWTAFTYQYSASIPHAVTSVNPETGSPDTYSYDANGNMTCRIEGGVTYSQTYNAENRISSIAKRTGDCATGTILESWSFAYDGDGTRVSAAHFTGASGTPDSTTSYFMGGGYELKDGATKKYYSIAGIMVAVNDPSAGSGQVGLQYLLTDHLGSTVAVTNSSGTLTSQQRYLPFGAPRTIPNSPILGTDFTYTGQRKLDDGMGGVMDYRARFYSPALGKFQQPDSIIPDPANPQGWNRFSYVVNNPTNHIDPTGHQLLILEFAIPVLLVFAAYIAVSSYVLENRVTREKQHLNAPSQFLDSVDPNNTRWHDPKSPCADGGNIGFIVCLFEVATTITTAVLCIVLCDDVVRNVTSDDKGNIVTKTPSPTDTPTAANTVTPTATSTTACPPPYIQCSSTQTSTPTGTATNAPTSTSTSVPSPTQTSTFPDNRRRFNYGTTIE